MDAITKFGELRLVRKGSMILFDHGDDCIGFAIRVDTDDYSDSKLNLPVSFTHISMAPDQTYAFRLLNVQAGKVILNSRTLHLDEKSFGYLKSRTLWALNESDDELVDLFVKALIYCSENDVNSQYLKKTVDRYSNDFTFKVMGVLLREHSSLVDKSL